MIKEYSYVAIGGIATKDISPAKYEALFPWMLNQAHKNGAKVHGLGYTRVDNLERFRFDSIDSTTWTVGGNLERLHNSIKVEWREYPIARME